MTILLQGPRTQPSIRVDPMAVVWPCPAPSERACTKKGTFFQGLADSVLTASGPGQGEQGLVSVPAKRGGLAWHSTKPVQPEAAVPTLAWVKDTTKCLSSKEAH